MEVRAARNLSHVSVGELRAIRNRGFAPDDPVTGEPLVLHHYQQRPEGPLIEVPRSVNSIWNEVLHPYGNTPGAGLTAEERAAHNSFVLRYWKSRATEELLRRGLE
jgi:hypothetical protein